MRAALFCALLALSVTGWAQSRLTLIKADAPELPRAALTQKLEGTVSVEITFDEKGEVEDVKLLSSPHEVLTEAVMNAVKQWKAQPPLENGKPVVVVTRRSFVFKLNKE